MPRQVHLFNRPSRFVAGTVGQPGDRTFFLWHGRAFTYAAGGGNDCSGFIVLRHQTKENKST